MTRPSSQLVRPCPECPFRTDIRPYLTRARVREIWRSVTWEGKDFPCHKTVDYEAEDTSVWNEGRRRCAGMAILCVKTEQLTQVMQIAERLGIRDNFDRATLELDAPVFDSFQAMEEAQPRR